VHAAVAGHATVVGRIALRSSASSETVGVRTSTLRVERFLALLFLRRSLAFDFRLSLFGHVIAPDFISARYGIIPSEIHTV
jgi:hypothetical protein